MSKKIRFKTPFDSQHAKGSQTLRNSSAKHFYHIFLTTLRDADLENISLTDICDLLTVNAMTAADMAFSSWKGEFTTTYLNAIIYERKISFLKNLLYCWKIYQISNMLKKHRPHSLRITEIRDPQGSQTLLKSAAQHS